MSKDYIITLSKDMNLYAAMKLIGETAESTKKFTEKLKLAEKEVTFKVYE